MIGLTLLFFISYINFQNANPWNDLGGEYYWMNQVVMIPMYLATFFSLFSAGVYFKQAKPALLETK
jgi:CDP-diacylglycerol--glycerol-3-phosphate 3-phosphatidyltransferase